MLARQIHSMQAPIWVRMPVALPCPPLSVPWAQVNTFMLSLHKSLRYLGTASVTGNNCASIKLPSRSRDSELRSSETLAIANDMCSAWRSGKDCKREQVVSSGNNVGPCLILRSPLMCFRAGLFRTQQCLGRSPIMCFDFGALKI